MINKYSPWEDIDKEKMRTRKDKVKWILKFLDLCVLWTCAVIYWEEVCRSLCHSARVARGDAWMMLRVRSITGSDSHFHCGAATVHPGTYCWSFLIFLPSSGPGLGEPNRGQDPQCPGEAHHGVNIHSSTRRAAAWLGWKRSSSGSKGHAVQAQSRSVKDSCPLLQAAW